ncbi:T9SS type A sorting domain-containing protein [Flavobacterium sp.]|uniref:T9SS type A sorting domain-containing protein n=1 Tax=Flavobacterium sp. TaxID=239 RepID=UPI002B4AD2E3|nr:T9SS type A sorting domain-containing protein [Flavobacterium sp.]HLF51985.1 T9SS type A sorting domain-containing protein [Flavobacterium sp.]
MKEIIPFFLVVFLFNSTVAFAQYGSLDPTFGDQGKVITHFGQYESDVRALAIQPDGKIIAAGNVFDHSGYNQHGLARYNMDGSLDSTFGTNGKVIGDVLGLMLPLNSESVLLQTNGKIIGGIASTSFNAGLIRYNLNGTLDTSFGVGGIVMKDSVRFNSLAAQSDEKIIAAGFLFEGSNRNFGLVRYSKDGVLDTNFGTNGVVATSIGGKDFGHAVTLQSNGKIIVSGSTSSDGGNSSDLAIVRYNTNGALDTTFGTNGIVIIDIDDNDSATHVKIQSDGKIVLTDYSYHQEPLYSFIISTKLLRLESNGDLDTSFGINGKVTAPFVGALTIQSDGKIVVAGSYENAENYNDIALARYLINGDLDVTFGSNGVVITSIGESTRSSASAVALQSDGKIVVGGAKSEAFLSSHPHSVLLRYNSGVQLSNPEFSIQKNTFSVYPNPVNEMVNLDFNLKESEELSIDLFNINGVKIANLIKGKTFQTGYHSQKLELPETLSKGIYFLNISNGSTASNVKIVK